MRKVRRSERRGQAGQLVVVSAIAALVLFGSMSLAVDASLLTNDQKILRNASDAAATSGSNDILVGNYSLAAEQQAAANAALYEVQQNFANENIPWTTSTTANNECAGTFNASGAPQYCDLVPATATATSKVWVWVADPPISIAAAVAAAGFPVPAASCLKAGGSTGTNNTSYDTQFYVETDICQVVNNNFALLIGAPTAVVGSHSIAYHYGPAGPFPFALYASNAVMSGNNPIFVSGDVFVGNGYCKQNNSGNGCATSSTNFAALCVAENAEPNPDTIDGSSDGVTPDQDVDDSGHIVYGTGHSVAATAIGNNPNYSQTMSANSCPAGAGNVNIYEQNSIAYPPTNCPGPSYPVSDTINGPSEYICEMAPTPPPNIAQPAYADGDPLNAVLCSGAGGGSATMAAPFASGIYSVPAGCTLTIDLRAASQDCVSFVLGAGASILTNTKGASRTDRYMTAFGYTQDSSATAALAGLSPTVAPKASCSTTVSNPTDIIPGTDNTIVWAAPVTGAATTAIADSSTGSSEGNVLAIGTVYIPGQDIAYTANSRFMDVGQVYCSTFHNQSGNHPDSDVTYDPGQTPGIVEILKLVE